MSNSSSASSKLLYSVGTGLGVTLLSGAAYWYYNYLKKDVIPQKWRRVGTLNAINFYPVKSCGALPLGSNEEINCELLGMRLDGFRDRTLMLVDDTDQIVTARTFPKMVVIATTKVGPTSLRITAEGMAPLDLDFAKLAAEAPGRDVHTSIWGAKLDGMLCGEKYDKWFSQCLLKEESGLRLLYYPYPKPVRTVDKTMVKEPHITRDDTGTFGDATSYMLMNISSVDDLNTRLKKPVDTLQFRGSFHLKMDKPQPYAEDNWGWVRIGDEAIFRRVAPCVRCIVPNVNAKTGERDLDGEPLKTLKTYRKIKNYAAPQLGIHMGIRQNGKIKLNDVIYVEDN